MATSETATQDRRGVVAVVAVLLAAGVVGLLWWLLSGDEDATTTGATTTEVTTSTETTTTAEVTTTEVTTTASGFEELTAEEQATVIYPFVDTAQRFDDPVAAARSFATELVGFTDPLVGDFDQGDARSGEVELRAIQDGPATTVVVRQLGEASTWWVVAADTPELVVDEPAPGQDVASPVLVSGRASAFEGTVEVRLHQDGQLDPIATGIVTGGATGELEPYEGELEFSPPEVSWGTLVLRTVSADDGRVERTTAQRLAFAGPS